MKSKNFVGRSSTCENVYFYQCVYLFVRSTRSPASASHSTHSARATMGKTRKTPSSKKKGPQDFAKVGSPSCALLVLATSCGDSQGGLQHGADLAAPRATDIPAQAKKKVGKPTTKANHTETTFKTRGVSVPRPRDAAGVGGAARGPKNERGLSLSDVTSPSFPTTENWPAFRAPPLSIGESLYS